MKILRKILKIAIIVIIINSIILGNSLYITKSINDPITIGLFAKDLNDDFVVFLRKNFDDIQKNSERKVEFKYFDAKFNKATQYTDIYEELTKGIDLILLDIVDINDLSQELNEISKHDVPVLIFNREPNSIDVVKSYKKAFVIGTDSKQAGKLQGKIIADAWNKHKDSIDKNRDNILQYILLVGEKNNETSSKRSRYSIANIKDAGIQTNQLASSTLNWNEDTAQSTVGALFARYGDKIEAVISNDDSMAVGAVKALQKYGYNLGDISKTIPVVGIDGFPDSMDLISKNYMLGTTIQDPNLANTIYTIGMNLVNYRNPVEGTPYKTDETGVAVRIPFAEYMGTMYQ